MVVPLCAQSAQSCTHPTASWPHYHRIAWVERDLKGHQVLTPVLQAGLPTQACDWCCSQAAQAPWAQRSAHSLSPFPGSRSGQAPGWEEREEFVSGFQSARSILLPPFSCP